MTFSKLSDKTTLCTYIKYIAALLVVNGHLFIFGNPSSSLTPFMNLGPCCVSLFFFLSGYGLAYNYEKKGNTYLKSFFTRRITKLIIPLIVAYAVTLPVYLWLKGPIEWQEVFTTILWGGPYLKFSWYVSEILVVYILFYIAMRIGSDFRGKLNLLTLGIIAMMALLFIARQPLWYIVSLPGFIAGLWYKYFESRLLKVLTVRSLITLAAATAIIWFIAWQWRLTGNKILTAYRYEFTADFISALLFPIAIVMFTNLARPQLPPPIATRSFYEVYLLQSCAMIISKELADSFNAYWMLTMLTVIVVAYGAYWIDGRLTGLISHTAQIKPQGKKII